MNQEQLRSAVSLVLIEAGMPTTDPRELAYAVARIVLLAEKYRRSDDGEREQFQQRRELRMEAPGAGKAH